MTAIGVLFAITSKMLILLNSQNASLYTEHLSVFVSILICLITSFFLILNTLNFNFFVYLGFKNIIYFFKYSRSICVGNEYGVITRSMSKSLDKELIFLAWEKNNDFFKALSRPILLNFSNINKIDFKEYLEKGCYNFEMNQEELLDFNSAKISNKLCNF